MTEAILFDIDGTLIDSVDLHAEAWQRAFEHFGYKVEFPKVRAQIGKGGDQLLPVFLSEVEQQRIGEELKKWRGDLFKAEYLPLVKPFSGVRQLFEKVLSNGQEIALASSAKGDEIKAYERIANIEDLVRAETTSDDVEKTKPHPDVFEAAMNKLKTKPPKDRIVVVGDTPHDAEAAKRAGLYTVGVLCGGFAERDLREAGCIAIYKDPQDLLINYDSSPLANLRSAISGREDNA